jgi:CubicO group peptidase (beta-lactamase class C family)
MNKKYIFSLIIVLSLVCCSTSFAQTAFNTDKMDSLLVSLATHNKMMGSVAVAKNGAILYNKAYGFYGMNGGQQLRSTPETEYRIGSISKMFTAVMIFQLIEEEKLKLETTLSDFFPQLPNAEKITISQLLNHRSGLHNFTDDLSYFDWDTIPQTHEQMLKRFSQDAPEFEPGTEQKYSNTNYILLGYIIEKLTGDSYAGELKKRITERIGLTRTRYGSTVNTNNNEAHSYKWTDTKWEQTSESDMSIPGGAGAIVSTPTDLTKFIEALFAYKLINKKSLEKMKPVKEQFGKGMLVIPFYNHLSYGHTGGIDEFTAVVGYFPKDSIAFAMTTNGLDYAENDITIGLLSICFDKPYMIPTFNKTVHPLSPEQLTAYEGIYATTKMPMKITIKKLGDMLTAQAAGQPSFQLEPVDKNIFEYSAADIRIEFAQPQDGKVTQFTLKQHGGEFVFTKE